MPKLKYKDPMAATSFKLQNPTLKKRYVPKVKRNEDNIQIRVANYLKRNYPEVIFISDAAGIKLTIGQAKRMKAMNSERGKPDMVILYPSRGKHGLCMELKQDGVVIYNRDGSLRKQMVTRRIITAKGIKIIKYDHLAFQARRLEELNRLGYLARFAVGYDNAIRLIDYYMGRPQTAELF